MLPSSQLRNITIKDYFVIVKRRAWVIILFVAITGTDATMKTMKKVPQYQASARILIEKNAPQMSPVQQVYIPTWDKEYVSSQINILTSRSLAQKVVDSLIASGDPAFKGKKGDSASSFLGGIRVSIVTGTQLLDIGYVSTDPILAAKYANALADIYIKEDIDRRTQTSRYASGWLQTQLVELKKKLLQSEEDMNDFIQKNQIVTITDIEKRTQGALDGLKQEKVKVESDITEMSRRYKSKHPKMIIMRTRVETLTKDIEEETKKVLDLNTKTMQYNSLKREMESNKALYESLLKKMKETEVSKDLETTNIRIIDYATVPHSPFSPNRKRDISRGISLGFFLGFILAFFLEYLDSTVKTAEDIEIYVRLPFLGYAPSAKKEVKSKLTKDIDLLSYRLPHSRLAEAYRSIRTSIIFSSPEDRPLKTILITSASPQEGKSTASINLGIVFAHANEKTIIIEADMHRPRVANSFGIDNKVGLSSVLAGASTLDAAIKDTLVPNLFLLPSGPTPPNPAELLVSAKSHQLFEDLKKRYDRIIVDSPPVLTVTDAAILANMTDGVVHIIRAGFRNIEVILKSRQRLNEVKARIIGVILNNVNVKREDSYYYYHYYYAQEKDGKS